MTRSRRSGISGFFSSIFSNRTESLAGEDRWRRNEWKRALVSIVIVALGIAIVEGIYRLTHYGDFRFVVYLASIPVVAGVPQVTCDSIAPYLRSHVRFVNGHVVIQGERLTNIGYLTSYAILCMTVVGALVSGFLSHNFKIAIGIAVVAAFFAYHLFSENPIEDLKNTIKDRSITVLSPDSIDFHAAPHLSIHKRLESASSRCGSDASFRWDQNVRIFDINTDKLHVDLLADPDTYDGPWGLCCRTIGIPFTGLDALIRHFNEHPEDRPLLATPEGVNLVNDILSQARSELTTRKGKHA
ncbi:hypothetical protein [Schaalia odontolytica]|uniref:Uncharacterized protein n=1 Tax=Schaalia odontolytica TaxID=1660 RepID=A0A2X0U4U7_9ACTO|nr:hypothetical protein [Schaalia odontolytica]WMS28422.1 hypothetical protein RDV55_05235 [Schaalia odontolytica]SPT55285.1 Uncharacterised protein [Schaalia odontolytica]